MHIYFISVLFLIVLEQIDKLQLSGMILLLKLIFNISRFQQADKLLIDYRQHDRILDRKNVHNAAIHICTITYVHRIQQSK